MTDTKGIIDKTSIVDTNKFSTEQEYALGTRYIDPTGRPWIYCKKMQPKKQPINQVK